MTDRRMQELCERIISGESADRTNDEWDIQGCVEARKAGGWLEGKARGAIHRWFSWANQDSKSMKRSQTLSDTISLREDL